MAIDMVECGHCGAVVESTLRSCPRCGSALKSVVVLTPPAVSYAEKYRGTEYAGPPDVVVQIPPRQSWSALLIGVGIVVVVVVLAVGSLVIMNGAPGTGATRAPQVVVARTPTPTPAPTLPPTITRTLAGLADPAFSAHIAIDSRLTLDGAYNQGVTQTLSFHLDATVSNGNESGTLTSNAGSYEFRILDGTFYRRLLPSGKWTKPTVTRSVLEMLPLFALSDPKMLQFVGQETKDGSLLNHLQTTRWWAPDPTRLAILDMSGLPISPVETLLDLWVTADGIPVTATFVAKTDTSDGSKHLLYIQTTYKLTDVGKPVEIKDPLATPTPKPKPSQTTL